MNIKLILILLLFANLCMADDLTPTKIDKNQTIKAFNFISDKIHGHESDLLGEDDEKFISKLYDECESMRRSDHKFDEKIQITSMDEVLSTINRDEYSTRLTAYIDSYGGLIMVEDRLPDSIRKIFYLNKRQRNIAKEALKEINNKIDILFPIKTIDKATKKNKKNHDPIFNEQMLDLASLGICNELYIRAAFNSDTMPPDSDHLIIGVADKALNFIKKRERILMDDNLHNVTDNLEKLINK